MIAFTGYEENFSPDEGQRIVSRALRKWPGMQRVREQISVSKCSIPVTGPIQIKVTPAIREII